MQRTLKSVRERTSQEQEGEKKTQETSGRENQDHSGRMQNPFLQ